MVSFDETLVQIHLSVFSFRVSASCLPQKPGGLYTHCQLPSKPAFVFRPKCPSVVCGVKTQAQVFTHTSNHSEYTLQ